MIVYTNQVNHLYVVKNVVDDVNDFNDTGDLSLHTYNDTHAYFKYKSPGGLVRSDLIPLADISKGLKMVAADDNKVKYKAYNIAIGPISPSDTVGTGGIYLKIKYLGKLGDGEDNQTIDYIHIGDVSNGSVLDAKDVAKKVNHYLAKQEDPAVQVLIDGVAASTFKDADWEAASFDSFVIAGRPKRWRRGIKSEKPVDFYIECVMSHQALEYYTSKDMGYDEFERSVHNGMVGYYNSIIISQADEVLESNGHNVADLEYFFMGERGDQYRNIGWPNTVDTEYLVDPSKEYDILTLHFSYKGDGVHVQKSEKDITFVGEKDTTISALYTAIKNL